jgi:hypothetical protein
MGRDGGPKLRLIPAAKIVLADGFTATALPQQPPSGVLASVKATADALTPWPSLAPMRELLASVIRNGTGKVLIEEAGQPEKNL